VSFELIPRGQFRSGPSLKPGECSLNKSGTLILVAADVARAKIGTAVCVLADGGSLRLGLRGPHSDEIDSAMNVTMMKSKKGKDTQRRAVNVARAVKWLDLELAAACGRYAVDFHDGLLIVNLIRAGQDGGSAQKAKK